MTQTITVDTSAIVNGQQADDTDVLTPIGNLKTAVENTLNGVQPFDQINLSTATTLTLASDAVTAVKSLHLVDTEGAAASDNLATINGGTASDLLLIGIVSAARTVTVKHGTGNIRTRTGNDITLSSTDTYLLLLLIGATWYVVNEPPGAIVSTLLLAASTTAGSSLRMPAGAAPSSPVEGDMWSDSTRKAGMVYSDGIAQVRSGLIFVATAVKTIANTVTETTLFGSGQGALTLPANFFTVGKTLRIRIAGYLGTHSVTPAPTIKIKLGAVTVTASLTVSSVVASMPNSRVFELSLTLTCQSTGATGTVIASGEAIFHNHATTGTAPGILPMPGTSAATIDTTASQVLDVTWTWDAANAANTITATNATVEVLG